MKEKLTYNRVGEKDWKVQFIHVKVFNLFIFFAGESKAIIFSRDEEHRVRKWIAKNGQLLVWFSVK